jgi:antirestriction protein ArdC
VKIVRGLLARFSKSKIMKPQKTPFDIYQIVTDRILKQIEETGKLVWQKPWYATHGNLPMNGKTKRPYEGVNMFLLQFNSFTSPYWLSFKQVEEMGGNIKKGEKSTQVVFWKMNKYTETNEAGEEKSKTVPLLRYYNVFNVEQCENITIASNQTVAFTEHQQIENAEQVIKTYQQNNPALQINICESSQAYYKPKADSVNMPLLKQFVTPAKYYSTFFHELAHSTGHETRLNRKEVATTIIFGSCDYGTEELTAELTAAFICAENGISNENSEANSIAYLKNWMRTIKADKKMFIMAAARANKAAKFITASQAAEVEEAA